MAGDDEKNALSSKDFDMLKHDIRNQLSNIQLALEGLKYEVDDPNNDLALYFDSMSQSAKKIDKLLGGFE
nr:histidine kinase dimerization/phospho-acceptor domain-containing protein [Mucilaginibacter sp. L294]